MSSTLRDRNVEVTMCKDSDAAILGQYHLPQGPSPLPLLYVSCSLEPCSVWTQLSFLGSLLYSGSVFSPYPVSWTRQPLTKCKVFCLGTEWPTLALRLFFIIFPSLLLEAFQSSGQTPTPAVLLSFFNLWRNWERGERKSKNKKEEEFSNPLLVSLKRLVLPLPPKDVISRRQNSSVWPLPGCSHHLSISRVILSLCLLLSLANWVSLPKVIRRKEEKHGANTKTFERELS